MQLNAPARPRVLIVEDDADIADLLHLYLRESYCVEVATDGVTALGQALTCTYEAIVLDIALPGLDGLVLCQTLRKRGVYTPVLMLTAQESELDKVLGLRAGADDYMTKPFSLVEVEARVEALLRRRKEYSPPVTSSRQLAFGDLTIDVDRREVMRAGNEIKLTAKEFDLLKWFTQRPGHVFSKDSLLAAVWGYNYEGYSHTVTSHINRLRGKIERDPKTPELILTVWGVGYRFRDR